MQLLRIKNAFSNLTLKIISGIIGFGVWFILNQSQSTIMSISVPVCFYNVSKDVTIESPEAITITIGGKRTDLYNLDLHSLSLHCDASQLQEGKNLLPVNASSLFLPSLVKLISYYPLNAVITVQQINKASQGPQASS